MAGLSAWLLVFVGCFNVTLTRVLFPTVPDAISRDSLIPDECEFKYLFDFIVGTVSIRES